MLLGLSIRDIVLIDRLDLALGEGLCVLTGETGAGKSILLDALGLALGRRADSGLIRQGSSQGSVTASFALPDGHAARRLLREQGLEDEGELRLRRVLGADGRSRAFVNESPVGVATLRSLGASLVEIHGQNDEQGLLDTAAHRSLLDAFGGLGAPLGKVRNAHAALRTAEAEVAAAEQAAQAALRDEDYLRHVLEEMRRIDPQVGEEAALAGTRALLMQGEKLISAVRDALAALEEGGGLESRLRAAQRALERVAGRAGDQLEPALQALDRAQVEVAEAVAAVEAAGQRLQVDPRRLEQAEERLFALRALARKHNVPADELPALQQSFAARLAAIEDGGERLIRLREALAAARRAYGEAASALSRGRAAAATRLDKAVAGELEPLKLGAARFRTQLEPLTADEAGPEGAERVVFQVATNPGAAFGPLARIASGGELSRFTLALKVVLARQGSAPTLIFDEVDRGIGGATADAVGERLARLADDLQVLVVTHSPQVAARGDSHWRIAKQAGGNGASASRVGVERLDAPSRKEEIARMLSGATVTDQARAAAGILLRGTPP